MRQLFPIILTLATINTFAQRLEIITIDKTKITTKILDSAARANMLTQLNGQQDNSIRKKWTARTYKLSDGSVLIEFYDKQALLVDNVEQFKSLEPVRFVKNTIDFLKKNISYKIELSFDKGREIIEKEKPERLTRYKSESPQWHDFEVYRLNTGQILYLDKSENVQSAAIFPDIKTLASEQTSILEAHYGSEDDEHLMKALASGDRLFDYDIYYHLIYPKYLEDLKKNHKLAIAERKVYVSDFFSNLYKSENGYYILVDEVNQKNGGGNKMSILTLRVFDNLQQVREAEKKYKEFSKKGVTSEHFYQKISGAFGQKYIDSIPQLVDRLPALLNFDREQLSFDSVGMDMVDEAIKWIGPNYKLFDSWFPSVLAYFGQCYIAERKEGVWTTTYQEEDKIWIPELRLNDGRSAWDWIDFYKGLSEGPIPMRWAGDWDGRVRRLREQK